MVAGDQKHRGTGHTRETLVNKTNGKLYIHLSERFCKNMPTRFFTGSGAASLNLGGPRHWPTGICWWFVFC